MKTIHKKVKQILLPPYIVKGLREVPWIKSTGQSGADDETIEFYADDLILITYGTRGSTPFSGPECLRYGGNTTSYQIYSPKMPDNILYLGDGGSGILEINQSVIKKCFSQGINIFTAPREKVSQLISQIINTYTHYHYDHLHTGAPLAGLFHADAVRKLIIGAWNPRSMFQNVFKRPIFPRDFNEMHASYSFYDIKDVRSSVLAFLPNGDIREVGISDFNNMLQQSSPQIKHKKTSYYLSECLIVKCFPTDHPDPCTSYRYENYDGTNRLMSCITFMTDHDIRDTDYRETYFKAQVQGCDAIYIDGQYQDSNYIPGFGHGRVEMIGAMARDLKIPNVAIGHHDPTREDKQIDAMVDMAKQANKGGEIESRIFGASDRMMLFIPAPARGRKGIIIGRMDFTVVGQIHNEANDTGPSSEVKGNYGCRDLTTIYQLHDHTKETK